MTRGFFTAVLALALMGVAAPSQAQHRSGGGGVAGGGRVGVAVPRGSVSAPRTGVVVGRPFVGSPFFYGPRFSFGFYAGYPFYYPYYYPYGYYGAYYGYPYYPPYPYTAGYGPGGYGPGGYGVDALSTSYGKVRIVDAPEHAPVYADGYYAGTVDDFNGTFQHLDLEPGTHHIEIRPQGQPVISFDVNAQPGETITYHAK
jgi:hypothetical protein